VVHTPPNTNKDEPKNQQVAHYGFDEEEGLESSKEEETPLQTLRRSTCQTSKRNRYNYSLYDFICIFDLFSKTNDPSTMKEEMEMEYMESRRLTMDDEIVALIKNDTWDLVPFPNGWKHIGCKWVFKSKIDLDDSVEKCKAKLVAKGYSQVEGIDFSYISPPFSKCFMCFIFFTQLYVGFLLRQECRGLGGSSLKKNIWHFLYLFLGGFSTDGFHRWFSNSG